MNPASYTSVGVSAAVLTPVIMWLTTWPIHSPTEAQAGALSALIIALIGGIHTIIQGTSAKPEEPKKP
jgi:hypothetical protein